jgi:hydrogenase maturation protein HypF
MKLKKIKLPFRLKLPILALGSQTKNTICFAKDSFAYLSPIHADLNTPEDFLSFKKDTNHFIRKNPRLIAYDLHPEYQSSKYAQQLSGGQEFTSVQVQHHHAHIASCMAENGLKNQKVIGVAFDGTGLGSDNTLWGAEFLLCNYKVFKRRAHLKEIPLLGGERAILEPWRLTVAWLYAIYKDRFLNLEINFSKGIDRKKWRILKKMYLSGFNAPLASSMGRLFDAVASLLLTKYKTDFEAGLARELETIAMRYTLCAMPYQFKVIKNNEQYIIDPSPMFKQIVLDLKAEESREKIAYRFHLAIAQMLKDTCLLLRKESKMHKVVLSGGVFQNKLLLRLSLDLLRKERFDVFIHKELSCNDSGISLGQAAVADFSRQAS